MSYVIIDIVTKLMVLIIQESDKYLLCGYIKKLTISNFIISHK